MTEQPNTEEEKELTSEERFKQTVEKLPGKEKV